MKTFKEFLEESALDESKEVDYRKIIKSKKHQKTIAYKYPIGVGGAYYGVGGEQGEGSGGGE